MKLILPILLQLYTLSICSSQRNTTLIVSRRAKLLGQNVEFRVVNGQPAELGDVPFQVAMMVHNKAIKPYKYETICGGTIIKPAQILTAAHCVEIAPLTRCHIGALTASDLKGTYAVAGILTTRARRVYGDSEGHGQWRRLHSGRYPKEFDFPRNDIAVLRTKAPFVFNENIHAIPIASSYVDYGLQQNKPCQISGYGRINDRDHSEVLLVAKVKIIDKRLCNFVHGMDMEAFVCSSDLVSDVHKGDSGGPLVCWNTSDPNEVNGTGVLVGVVSGKKFGILLGTFYSRVSNYVAYINRCLKNKLTLYLIVIIAINFALSLF